jgi:hypothetical protein
VLIIFSGGTLYMLCMSFDARACMAQTASGHTVYHAIALGLRPLTVWVTVRQLALKLKMMM